MNNSNIIQIYDPSRFKTSLSVSLLISELTKRGNPCKQVIKLDKSSKLLLITFRSPWPSFLWILQKMKKAGIPIHRNQREDKFPLIIAGGVAMRNPYPILDFMDAIWVGDATEEMFDALSLVNSTRILTKKTALQILSKIGFFIPGQTANKIPVHKIIPYTLFSKVISENKIFMNSWWESIKKNKILQFEIKRGCGRGCTFCVDSRNSACSINEHLFEKELKKTFKDNPDISLVRLSFPSLNEKEFLTYLEIVEKIKSENNYEFKIDIGSTVPDQFTLKVAKKLYDLGQTSMVFAMEVAEGLINKTDLRKENKRWLTDSLLTSAIRNGLAAGLNELVLYHLSGFPSETDEHILAYTEFVKNILKTYPQIQKIYISSGPVFPTIDTPLEHESQISFPEAKRRWYYFKSLFKNEKKVKLKWMLSMTSGQLVNYKSKPETSFIRAYFYRASSKMNKVLKDLVNDFPNSQDYLKISIKTMHKYMIKNHINYNNYLQGKECINSGFFENIRHFSISNKKNMLAFLPSILNLHN